MKSTHTFGAEIEKPVSDINTQKPHGVTQQFFNTLYVEAEQRNAHPDKHQSDIDTNTTLGIISDDLGEQGIDHGFNILETASIVHSSLENLNNALWNDLQTTQAALEKENATVINFSNHPLARNDLTTYKNFVAPKGLYPVLWSRGWNFTTSITANAQNSPATGISVDHAADAVSVIIGAGAAMIALFGNSPFINGEVSLYKESRVAMWDTMMKFSKFAGDRIVSRFPKNRFHTLAQYFSWMFGEQTAMHFVLDSATGNDYKGLGDRVLFTPLYPSVLEFLEKPEWDMYYFADLQKDFPFKRVTKVKPNISHLEVLQWGHFAGARVRFGLKNQQDFPLKKFLSAIKQEKKKGIENIFEQFSQFMYIEGRDPGANFPDEELWNAGEDIAQSVLIAPSALQKGLLFNLEKTVSYIDSFDWHVLEKLRNAAITDGLHGKVGNISVKTFTENILLLAKAGLEKREQKYLAYPLWVLEQEKNGADRAIAYIKTHKGIPKEAISSLIQKRAVLLQ
jgi:hypothetical protein